MNNYYNLIQLKIIEIEISAVSRQPPFIMLSLTEVLERYNSSAHL